MEQNLLMIELEGYRNPIRLELVHHVVPLLLFFCFVFCGLGYAWAMTAYRSFVR